MKKILIIEDEKDMVTGLKFNLEARDFSVIAAYDGETGYQKALEEKPDLLILDEPEERDAQSSHHYAYRKKSGSGNCNGTGTGSG